MTRMTMRKGRLFRAWALAVLLLLAATASGCQFLQNEFFLICPTPKLTPQVMPDVRDAP